MRGWIYVHTPTSTEVGRRESESRAAAPATAEAKAEEPRRGESQEMSASSATAHAHDVHAGHHELGFVRTYIFSTDHKMIARQFLFMGLFMMVLGGLLALIVRWQLAWPETAGPVSAGS